MGDSMVLFAIIAVVLFAVYVARRKRRVKKTRKVVVVGDSLLYPALHFDASWTAIVAQETGLEVIHAGWPGDTFEGMAERFRKDVLAYMPTHCIILGGANDAAGGCSPTRIADALTRLVSFCQQHNITPLVGSLIPVNPGSDLVNTVTADRMDGVREAVAATVRQLHVEMLDFYSAFLDDNGQVRGDLYMVGELQPNETGRRVMADIVRRAFVA